MFDANRDDYTSQQATRLETALSTFAEYVGAADRLLLPMKVQVKSTASGFCSEPRLFCCQLHRLVLTFLNFPSLTIERVYTFGKL